MAIQVDPRARLPEVFDAEGLLRDAERSPMKASACGWPSSTDTTGTSSSSAPTSVSSHGRGARNPRLSRSGLVTTKHVRVNSDPGQGVGRFERLGHDHTGAEDVHGTIRGIACVIARVAQSIRATKHSVPVRLGRRRRRGLGRSVASTIAGRGSRRYAPRSQRGRSSRIHSTSRANAGSKYAMPGSATPIDGVMTDWWAPPSGASVMPDGVAATTKRPPA
jgi:hypothetical protein